MSNEAAPAPECMYRNGCQTPADCRASGRCFESNYPHKRAAPDAEHSTDGAESRRAGHAPTIGPSPSTYADDLVRLLHGASDGYSSVNLNGAAKMCHDAAALIGELRAMVEQQAREVAAAQRECRLLTHKVITCGVAATHPDPKLSERAKDYGGPWDSPQAQSVRELRARAERAERDRDDWKRLAENWTACADAAQQPPEFYEKYNEGTMRAMQALLTRARCEADAARAAIAEHNDGLQADCDARQSSDLCKAYVGRGMACTDCPRGYAIDAARAAMGDGNG